MTIEPNGIIPRLNAEPVVIMPRCGEPEKTVRSRAVLDYALEGIKVKRFIEHADELDDLHNERILFVINLGESAVNLEYYRMLKKIRLRTELFDNCLGGVIVDGQSELFTKSVARELVFAANRAGCAFVGQPLVEGTASLANFNILAETNRTDQMGAYLQAAHRLTERVLSYQYLPPAPLDILVVHASNSRVSNTWALWEKVKPHLGDSRITEIGLRNGSMVDCSGCSFTTCLHFGEQGGCLYGGVMVEDVYPAMERCDALVLLCPNYNDALSANLTAFINRLTALFRKVRFYDKRLFGIIVSGYSGGDILAEQLIAALCMNKTLFLPASFCLLETANDPGSILQVPELDQKAADFARRILGSRVQLGENDSDGGGE